MKLILTNKKIEAEDTMSLFFTSKKEVNYLPGQYFYFTLPNLKKKDSRGPSRHFTISSSPTEGKILRITTRLRKNSLLKKTLSELKIGNQIEGEGPSGTFILDEFYSGPHVFLAGGIGITPARSAIKYHLDNKLKSSICLIYSNKTPEQITFKKELEEWAKKHKNIQLNMTITRPEETKEPWRGLTGRIDANMIKNLSPKPHSTFWISGPPGFVDAMEKVLSKLKIPPKRQRSEKFTGY